MVLLRVVLVALGVFVLSAECVNLGLCSGCGCVKSECDYPKTAEECQACANAVGKERISMEDGFCWVLVGATSEGDCALRTFSKLSGCSGFNGYNHYGGGNKNCWAKWKSPGQRRRRDVVNFWNTDIL